MKLHQDDAGSAYRISGYGSGYVTVNEQRLTRSVIITPDHLERDWPPDAFEEITRTDMEMVVARRPEIVLLGTGARQHFPSPVLVGPLHERRIGFEVMDTPAACRTYNILMAEGRLVAAALILVRD